MSFGLRKFSGLRPADTPPPMASGTPSMTNSGSLLALIDVPPRIRTAIPPPGSLLSTTCTPGTFALMSSSGLMMRPGLNSFGVTATAEPVLSRASCVP